MFSSTEEVLKLVKDECYENKQVDYSNHTVFCEVLFDGIMCWPRTPGGHTAKQLCSNSYIKSTLQGFVTKKCSQNGLWYLSPDTNMTWTNYTACGTLFIKNPLDVTDTELIPHIYNTWIPIIKKITHVGYVTSLITLLIASAIFIIIKRLHCSRNSLHLHLFGSFIMRAAVTLLKDGLFINGVALTNDAQYVNGEPIFTKHTYSWICKAIVGIKQYFVMSNFMFLLMEGTYLHNLMFLSLYSDKKAVTLYYTLGWGIPVFFVISWAILRALFDDDICWTRINNKYIHLLIELPIAASVLVNFILFTIIIRVLCLKLNKIYIQQRSLKYRRLLRSTLLLVPVFGIPYTISLLLSIDRGASPTLTVVWMFFDQSFAAFQGLFAALVYCLLNSDVRAEIKRRYNSIREKKYDIHLTRTKTFSHSHQVSLPSV